MNQGGYLHNSYYPGARQVHHSSFLDDMVGFNSQLLNPSHIPLLTNPCAASEVNTRMYIRSYSTGSDDSLLKNTVLTNNLVAVSDCEAVC